METIDRLYKKSEEEKALDAFVEGWAAGKKIADHFFRSSQEVLYSKQVVKCIFSGGDAGVHDIGEVFMGDPAHIQPSRLPIYCYHPVGSYAPPTFIMHCGYITEAFLLFMLVSYDFESLHKNEVKDV